MTLNTIVCGIIMQPVSPKLIFTEIGKSKVINKAIQDIGMGTYQWQLFVLCGFGWMADKYVLPY